jgi:hypothetical protein
MRVILAPRRAAAIALRNPEALVVDYDGQSIRRGADQVVLGAGQKRTQVFQLCAAFCCVIGSHLTRSDLIDLLWGDDEEGGPLRAENVVAQMIHCTKPFQAWAGLRVVRYRDGRTVVSASASPHHGESFRIRFRGVVPLKAAA